MWDSIKKTVITVLATLGVLFVIIMLIPMEDDEEASAEIPAAAETTVEAQAIEESAQEEAEQVSCDGDACEIPEDHADIEDVHIPEELLSTDTITFRTTSLDGEIVTQEIFSDYDITIVHVWGTYCEACVDEMKEYASFAMKLPSNIDLIGIICDVYDGIDRNQADAYDILEEADAGFMNLRTSDDIYDLTAQIKSIPASFFVDRDGRIIGDIYEGTGVQELSHRLEDYLKDQE